MFQSSLLSRLLPKRKVPVLALQPLEFPDIPRLQVVRKLGDGGMASVYLARQISTKREVAVKIMANHLQSNPVWAERFLDEARRLAELSHPNIVPVFDWGNHGGTGYIVMEYIKGGDLLHRLDNCRVTVKDVIEITKQLASGLDFASEKGYVHRDIKPDNILFREDGSPCILDFGIAKDSASNTTISSQGLAIGTGAYMSPEQAQPQGRSIDGRSDLYSLGAVLYQMLVGTRPFEFRHQEPAQVFQLYLFAHVNSPPPALPEPFTPFQPIMDQLLAKDPGERFSRGNELRLALAALENQLPEEYLSLQVRDSKEPTVALETQKNAALGASPKTELNLHHEAPPAESSQTSIFKRMVGNGRDWLIAVATVTVVGVVGLGYYEVFSGGRETIAEFTKFAQSLWSKGENSQEQVLLSGFRSAEESDARVEATAQKTSPALLKEIEIQALLSQIKAKGVVEPDDLSDVRETLALYQQLGTLDKDNAVAQAGIASIVKRQEALITQNIVKHEFETIPAHLELLSSIAPEVSGELTDDFLQAQQAFIQEQRRKQRLEEMAQEIQALVASVHDGSSESKQRLREAKELLTLAQADGLTEERAGLLDEKISAIYLKEFDGWLAQRDVKVSKSWLADANFFVGSGVEAQLKKKLVQLQSDLELERKQALADKQALQQKRLAQQKERERQEALLKEQEHQRELERQAQLALEDQVLQSQAESQVVSSIEGDSVTSMDESTEIQAVPEEKPPKKKFRTFGSF